ncbi:unnamed protein product [Caretta caretta]
MESSSPLHSFLSFMASVSMAAEPRGETVKPLFLPTPPTAVLRNEVMPLLLSPGDALNPVLLPRGIPGQSELYESMQYPSSYFTPQRTKGLIQSPLMAMEDCLFPSTDFEADLKCVAELGVIEELPVLVPVWRVLSAFSY